MSTSKNAQDDLVLINVLNDVNSTEREKQKAFEKIYSRYQNQLMFFFSKNIKDSETAEDLKMLTSEKVHMNIANYDLPRTVTVDILDAGKAEKYQTLLQIERGELKALPAQELQALENKKHSAFIEDYDHFREYLDKNSEMGFRFVRKSDLYEIGLKILDMGI